MGQTATMGETAAGSDLPQLLAEAAAGLGGADERLATRLRPDLEALLNERLAGPGPMPMAEAGHLVLRHWHHLAGTPGAHGRGGGKARGGRKGAAGTGTGKSRRGGKGKAARQGEGDAPTNPAANAVADPAGHPLFACFAEEAAAVMQELVSAALERAEPEGPAMQSLRALAALAQLDPPLARVARLRWFAGLDEDALAALLGRPAPHVQRDWIKARAFLAAAARATGPG
jgi:hypothetical protein